MADPESLLQRRFDAAVKVIRCLPEDGSYELSDEMLVMFYSYYKQATAGPCNTLKPNSWDPLGKAKWEAWKGLGDMPKDQAMEEYVQEIQLIIETLPVTDRMAELMDVLDPFYEVVEDEDQEVIVSSKPALSSTGTTNDEKDDGADVEQDEEEEGESSDENPEDDVEMQEAMKDSNTLTEEGLTRLKGSPVLNRSVENSVSSTSNDTHSSLNTEEEEEELVYSREPSTEPQEFCPSEILSSDESDDEMYSDSMELPTSKGKGSRVPRVYLADMSATGSKMQKQQGGNIETECKSPDGKPQGVTPPFPHPPILGTVQTDKISPSSSRRDCQLVETNPPAQHDNLPEHRCQGDGQCWETQGIKDKQALNTQIAVTLSQLQDNMQDVLQRLTTLEGLTSSQAEIFPLKSWHSEPPKKRLPWWSLDMSPIAVVLAVMWPFAVHWLMQFYLQKRRRWLK